MVLDKNKNNLFIPTRLSSRSNDIHNIQHPPPLLFSVLPSKGAKRMEGRREPDQKWEKSRSRRSHPQQLTYPRRRRSVDPHSPCRIPLHPPLLVQPPPLVLALQSSHNMQWNPRSHLFLLPYAHQ